mmetsp:Transcript_5744/g.7915  ORF Transcript_5744/g.7915 Transcript_5744/m.7915 type:complete len:451 (-) Transcript_5744:223-1575(-)
MAAASRKPFFQHSLNLAKGIISSQARRSSLIFHARSASSFSDLETKMLDKSIEIRNQQSRKTSALAVDKPTLEVRNPFVEDEMELELDRPRDGIPKYVESLINQSSLSGWLSSPEGLPDPFALVQDDITSLADSIKDLLAVDHPVLATAAKYFFELDGGKKVRPTMVLLMSRATNLHLYHTSNDFALTDFTLASQRRLAEITEMIHTASLFHDDVIDKADKRRGNPTVNKAFGNKLAILAGDFLLARASVSLARLRSVEVVELVSTVIEELVKGEVMQMRPPKLATRGEALEHYLRKNYYKTGSLMSNGCQGAALLASDDPFTQAVAFEYGKRVGLAFQLIDDILDFEADWKALGKPALADLRAGLATAPVLIAAAEFPQLDPLIERKFKHEGDIEQVLHYLEKSNGIQRTKELAYLQADLAIESILQLCESDERDALINLALKVVKRNH